MVRFEFFKAVKEWVTPYVYIKFIKNLNHRLNLNHESVDLSSLQKMSNYVLQKKKEKKWFEFNRWSILHHNTEKVERLKQIQHEEYN